MAKAEKGGYIQNTTGSTDDWRVSFAKTISNNVDTDNFTIIPAVGAGMTVNQTGGNLLITSGTTVNSETILRSTTWFDDDIILRYGLALSQRIVNQSFFVELVDIIGDGLAITINSATSVTVTIPGHDYTSAHVGQSFYIGGYAGTGTFVPGRYAIASVVAGVSVNLTVAGFAAGTGTVSAFGMNYHHVLYDGASATNTKYDAQRKGYASGDTSVTINTTAAPGHSGVVSMINSLATFADHGATGGFSTIRADRTANLPVDTDKLYLQIRVVNGASAPASTTTLTLNYVSVITADSPLVTTAGAVGGSSNSPQQVQLAGGSNTVDTELPAAAAIADGFANPTAPSVMADNMMYNNASWDRVRNNYVLNLDTSVARTASGSGTTGTNHNFRGASIFVNVTAVSGTTPTMTVRLQESFDGGTTWRDVDTTNLQTASITGTGISKLVVYPGVTTAANASLNSVLPRTFRLAWTIGGTTPSFTFASWVNFVL
jgi:hypothetical protein